MARPRRRLADTHEAQPHDNEHPLFILYDGTTGKPKGIFHTSGGYLTKVAYTNAVVDGVHPRPTSGAPPTSAG